MPVTFVRSRIAGSRSFAGRVSIEIPPGLTGIVGPNESFARLLRGGEMDDLIFAGTAARLARNLAEAVLTVEGAAGRLPHDGSDPSRPDP